MINQFAELGSFYRQQEGIEDGPRGRLAQFAQDPGQKFRTQTVLILVFSDSGFGGVQVEQYDAQRRLDYLYRVLHNHQDVTPTTGLRPPKKGVESEFDEEIRKKLERFAKSIADAHTIASDHPEWECPALRLMQTQLEAAGRKKDWNAELRATILNRIKQCHPADPKEAAILTVAWRGNESLHRVGDFRAFQQALIDQGERAASSKKGIDGDVKGYGQCCVCGATDVEVSGLLQIPNFKLYTLDKPGSVSGGFNKIEAWRNFPACRDCCEKVDFAGERVKKYLTFDYYSPLKYVFLPQPLRPQPTIAFQLLDRLISFRLKERAQKRLTAAEDELFFVVAEMEENLLQVDLLFYQPNQNYFRPALYVSGLLPSRFRALFKAKDRVDAHPWLQSPSPGAFVENEFSFDSMNQLFPHANDGKRFDDDFLSTTRAALELRPFSEAKLLQYGMRTVRQYFVDGKAWPYRLADLFRTITFFEELTNTTDARASLMELDYGSSPQADRVRAVLQGASGKLRTEAAAQAAFLVGACCGRIETLQLHARGSSPFEGKLKGFRLNQADVQGLFVAAKDKAKAYGEGKVSGLLVCAAVALAASPERWSLSPDEVSYYFALGHALRPRFAGEREESEDNNASPQE
jgi:CRISPR-associated protein Csh1